MIKLEDINGLHDLNSEIEYYLIKARRNVTNRTTIEAEKLQSIRDRLNMICGRLQIEFERGNK